MPFRIFSVEEVTRYLHLTARDIDRLMKEQAIPFEVRGGRPVFLKREIDAWASQRILGLQDRGLAEYHQQSSHGTRGVFQNEAIMGELIEPAFIEPAMAAKTRASALRALVALAEKTGRLNDRRELLASLEAREALCSTGLPGGLALLHPRHHQPYMFESSFIVLGRPVQEIPFGASDGRPTDLFFLVCCQDDRIHLHTLARLCMMAQRTDLLAQLRAAPDAATMCASVVAAETEVLTTKKPSEGERHPR
jgi:nitrogen PTS system EIIA component